jgi:hypothetical protein
MRVEYRVLIPFADPAKVNRDISKRGTTSLLGNFPQTGSFRALGTI